MLNIPELVSQLEENIRDLLQNAGEAVFQQVKPYIVQLAEAKTADEAIEAITKIEDVLDDNFSGTYIQESYNETVYGIYVAVEMTPSAVLDAFEFVIPARPECGNNVAHVYIAGNYYTGYELPEEVHEAVVKYLKEGS